MQLVHLFSYVLSHVYPFWSISQLFHYPLLKLIFSQSQSRHKEDYIVLNLLFVSRYVLPVSRHMLPVSSYLMQVFSYLLPVSKHFPQRFLEMLPFSGIGCSCVRLILPFQTVWNTVECTLYLTLFRLKTVHCTGCIVYMLYTVPGPLLASRTSLVNGGIPFKPYLAL